MTLIINIQQMSEFRLFETNKKAKFLNKAKEVKALRQEDIKKNQSVVVLQKNIRTFLTYRRNDNPTYPLFISTLKDPSNRAYIEEHWPIIDQSSVLLKNRLVNLSIKALDDRQELPIHPGLLNAVFSLSHRVELKPHEYQSILGYFWNDIDSEYLLRCFRFHNFKEALKTVITRDIHAVIDMVVKFQEIDLVNQMLNIYLAPPNHESPMDIEGEENQERLLKSYYNAVSLLTQVIEKKQDNNAIIHIVSILVDKLKSYYTNIVLTKYNIDRKIYQSDSLRQEIDELVKEKRQWEEYEGHLYHLCSLIPSIMENYISRESKSLTYALDILIEVTKLSQSVVNLNLSAKDFFALIENLNVKFFLNTSRSEQMNHYYQCLIIVLMLEKYLQGINDLKFIENFRFDSQKLKEIIRTYVIKFMKNLITFNNSLSIVNEIIKHSVAFLNNLYNKIFRTNLLKTTVFEDHSINIFQGKYKYSNYGNASYMKELMKIVDRCPYLLPIETRFLVFKKYISEDEYHDGYHGNKTITIRRGREFQDAIDQLYNRNIKSRFHLKFINEYGQEEMGIDAGGLTKEFLTRVFKTAFSPKFGRFIENDKKELLPNPEYYQLQDYRVSRQYEFIGRLLGKSLYSNIMLGMKFAGPFLNLLINGKNSFDDLLQIDPALYKSLIYIVEMKSGAEQLQLTFQYHDNITKKLVNLLQGGRSIKVNDKNKMEYVNLLINYKVNRSMERQTRCIRKGLREVISESWIKMFNYGEFNYLLSGTGVIDVADWRKHSLMVGGNEALVNNFWSIVAEFTEEQKSLLLKFVTSCERPSFLGFKDLSPPFTVRVTQKDDNMLPVSHTCSNYLDLPEYSSKKIMREKLLYAIKSGAGFEMG